VLNYVRRSRCPPLRKLLIYACGTLPELATTSSALAQDETIGVPPERIPEVRVAPPDSLVGKLILVRGRIAGREMVIDTIMVREGYSPNRITDGDDIRLTLVDGREEVVDSVDVRDPRIVHVLEPGGKTYIRENTEFLFSVPYVHGATALLIRAKRQLYAPSRAAAKRGVRPQDLRLPQGPLARIELRKPFEKFCSKRESDPECRFFAEGGIVSPRRLRPHLRVDE
jgi:hypothetical protein